MNIVDTILNKVVARNYDGTMTEQDYWENLWKNMLERFDQDKAPFEEVDEWERECDLEMVSHYEHIFGGLEGKSILELGCGGGHISCLLARKAREVVLVDYSPKALDYARRTARYLHVEQKIRFVQADLLSIHVNETFDVCYNCGVLEHYSEEVAARLLHIMAALGREGAAVTVPNLLSPELIFRMIREGKGSERYFSPRTVEKLIRRAGLVPIRWLPVNYWSPSFMGPGLAKLVRIIRVPYWRLAWLYTWFFKEKG